MPYKKKRTKRKIVRKRPTTYKKTYDSDMVLIKNPTLGGFPKSVFTKLRYVYNGVLNPGVAGTNATTVFRCNSLYDPDYSGAGAQPRGFDQWMGLYDHYFVKRSKIVVEFHNGDSTYEVQVGIALRDDVSTEATTVDYQEQDCVFGMLGRVGSSNNHRTLTKYFNYGKSNYAKYTTSENKGSVSANPAEQNYYHVFCGSPWSQDAANTYITATITYDCLFTELKDIAQS